jgi:hypothetical protein
VVDLEHSVFRCGMDRGGSSLGRSGGEDAGASGYRITGGRVACWRGVFLLPIFTVRWVTPGAIPR